jgi:hypothetical protein
MGNQCEKLTVQAAKTADSLNIVQSSRARIKEIEHARKGYRLCYNATVTLF